MRRATLFTGVALIACSSLAFAAPESLLPSIFDEPAPSPTPAPTPTPTPSAAPTPSPSAPTPSSNSSSRPVVQAVPSSTSPSSSSARPVPRLADVALPAGFPTLEELEAMEEDQIDDLLGLKPKFDVPPAARRSMEQVGIMSSAEGGFASGSLARQPAALIKAAIAGSSGQMVSRWGHILLRRALASRMDAPEGMEPADFAELRAGLLNRMGEGLVARRLVQDIDTANYNSQLADAAFDAYLSSGDVLGICPVAQLHGELREGAQWSLTQAICTSYAGNPRSAARTLDRALGTGEAPAIDVLLAQRFAGVAGGGRRAVNIEWEGVDALTPWRFSLARALGVEIPDTLRNSAGGTYDFAEVLMPSVAMAQRISVADRAAARGVVSSSTMVNLYSALFASNADGQGIKAQADQLRQSYIARTAASRLSAMRGLWGAEASENGAGKINYGRQVLTAYAAARIEPSEALLDVAPDLISSMLTAGLDANALRWGGLVMEGSQGWGLLVLAQPDRPQVISAGAFDSYLSDDESANSQKSRFLLAGLAGLGRLDATTIAELSEDLGEDLMRESAWSTRIMRAAEYRNQALVALLAGVGMQGARWDQMTARQLFNIVSALNKSGLTAEARMIAAEAVARG